MIEIILMEPEHPGNVGAICRAMANFNLKHLTLINPQCDTNASELIARAKHAKEVLKNIKVKKKSYLKTVDTLIGTTARMGSDYNIPRSPLTLTQFKKIAEKKNIFKTRKKVCILLGREGNGLYNDEVALCDFLITIPTSKKYPVLNLSHAATIIFYELFTIQENITEHVIFASANDKKHTHKIINETLNKLPFQTKDQKETQKKVWKRIIGKTFLTKREAFAIMGIFRKIKTKIEETKKKKTITKKSKQRK